jgi:hypothetical protein
MILRLVGTQLDSKLLSQGSGGPSWGLVRSVHVVIGKAVSDRGGGNISWTPRQNPANWQGNVSEDGQDLQCLDFTSDDPGSSDDSSRILAGWNTLDIAAKYTLYASIFAAPPRPFLLNVFA